MQHVPVVNRRMERASFPPQSSAILVYFSAHWCPPCRQFTPLLKSFYESARSAGAQLEIVFVSSDRSEQDMISYFQGHHGDWLAVSFFSDQRQFLSNHFNVRGIPALVLVSKGTLQAVPVDVRQTVMQLGMGGSSGHIKNIVDEWRSMSGATLFESIPRSMCLLTKDEREGVFDLLQKLLTNIADHPTESKYRQLKLDNPIVKRTISDLPCGSAPLQAVGFSPNPSSGVYTYSPSVRDPTTVKLVLMNRESNGLSILTASAPVPAISTPAPTLHAPSSSNHRAIPTTPVVPEKQVKFRIHYKTTPPVETDEISAGEIFSVLPILVESLTDVPEDSQLLMCPDLVELGALLSAAESTVISKLNFAPLTVFDLFLFARDSTSTSTTDVAQNDSASALRAKLNVFAQTYPVAKGLCDEAIRCQIYEVPSHQQAALKCIPLADLHKAVVAKGGAAPGYTEELFRALLGWFKTSFFSWVDKLPCEHCKSVSTVGGRRDQPTPQELNGMASVVEVFLCSACGGETRFPRFNHPVVLLTTRRGRCGEFANCFSLLARSVGFEVRKVNDSADHVWVETWIPERSEWIHCDPCENVFDQPTLYEKGWGKSASWTVAVSRCGVKNVTKRYWSNGVVEGVPGRVVEALNDVVMSHASKTEGEKGKLMQRDAGETQALSKPRVRGNTGVVGGRTTGDIEWRLRRGEAGVTSEVEEKKDVGVFGGVHGDTVSFSDEEVIRKVETDGGTCSLNKASGLVECSKAVCRLTAIHLWTDGKLVTGIQSVWGDTEGVRHLSTSALGKEPSASLTLEDGEVVKSVTARTGALVDYLKLETSAGRVVEVGNPLGGSLVEDDDSFRIMEGEELVGLKGGLGGHLHNIGLIKRAKAVAETGAKALTFGERVKAEFGKLVAAGMNANEAAAKALKTVTSEK